MAKRVLYLILLISGSPALFAQSTGNQGQAHAEAHNVTQSVTPLAPPPAPVQVPIVNIMTVIGDNIVGLPCLNCILGILGITLGLPAPLGQILPGSSYQIDSFLVDNSYTGSCTFTFAVLDHHRNVITSVTQTLNEFANTQILLSAPVTIPTNAKPGLGSVSTAASCGTSQTVSKSAVVVCTTNPPDCRQ